MNGKVTEGLEQGDLRDLVEPLLSVDEYESKIAPTDEVIVIAFFVEDEEPANDLSGFLNKSVYPILDTDVSPAPNEQGYFLVFVELPRNEDFPDNLFNILNEIEKLIDIKEKSWYFKPYALDDLEKLSKESIKTHVALTSIESHEETDSNEEMKEFIEDSMLDTASIDNNKITFEKRGKAMTFEFVDFGRVRPILKENKLDAAAPRMDTTSASHCRRLESMFGPQWEATDYDGLLVLTKSNNQNAIVLRTFS